MSTKTTYSVAPLRGIQGVIGEVPDAIRESQLSSEVGYHCSVPVWKPVP